MSEIYTQELKEKLDELTKGRKITIDLDGNTTYSIYDEVVTKEEFNKIT